MRPSECERASVLPCPTEYLPWNLHPPKQWYIDAIRQEHELLRDKAGKIHDVLSGPDPTPEEIVELLHDFHSALVVHFSNEEAEEGFFEEVTSGAPQLTKQADRLCVEHRELLKKAADLHQFAKAGSPSLPWLRELRVRCHEFHKQLMNHESQENHLLLEAHTDLGTVD